MSDTPLAPLIIRWVVPPLFVYIGISSVGELSRFVPSSMGHKIEEWLRTQAMDYFICELPPIKYLRKIETFKYG